jgi:hypothetical protein
MIDPDTNPQEPKSSDVALWLLIGLMILIAAGGLVYGFAYPSLHATNPPQTLGAAPSSPRGSL